MPFIHWPRAVVSCCKSRLAPLLLCAGFAVFAGCGRNSGASVSPAPPGPAAEKSKPTLASIAEKAKPATVLIYVDFEAAIQVPEVTFDTNKLKIGMEDLINRRQLSVHSTNKQKYVAALNLLYSDPESYLTSGVGMRQNTAKTSAAGSGFIITPDGYIVTCAHVVEPDEETLKMALTKTLEPWIQQDIKNLAQDLPQKLLPGSVISEGNIKRLALALGKFYAANMRMGEVKKQVYVLLPSKSADLNAKLEPKPCDVQVSGKPYPEKDVAVIKMAGSNLPTLPLAQNLSANGLRTGDALHVYGYPGVATFNPNFSTQSLTEPSMTNGTVSRIATMAGGWQVVQTDASTTHGNSGGPVMNDAGEVVGILTFGSADENNKELVQGFNFLMPSDIIREFTNKVNITSPPHP